MTSSPNVAAPGEDTPRSRLVAHLLANGVLDGDAEQLADAVDPEDSRTIVVTIPGSPVAGMVLGIAPADGRPPTRVRVEAVRPALDGLAALSGLSACVGYVLAEMAGPVDMIVRLGPAGAEVET